MYGVRLRLCPTSGLTFRRVPFSTLEMLTYPFVPPTTLSGFVERLIRQKQSGDGLPEANRDDPQYYVLPRAYHALGALPDPPRSYRVLTTPRQGVRKFGHTVFSQLRREGDKETYQLYRWEYLFAEAFIGYILHEDAAALSALGALENMGGKLGKEGWAFVEEVSAPFTLERTRERRVPATLLSAMDVAGAPARMYPLYRYAWREDVPQPERPGTAPAPISGFLPFLAAITQDEIELDYYLGAGVAIPESLLAYY
jgi:hypothetical protein